MVKPKAKGYIASVVAILLWVGAVFFALIVIFPAYQDLAEAFSEVEVVESTLRERLHDTPFPSEAAIQRSREVKEELTEELRASRDFYSRIQSEVMDREVLESGSEDPDIVAQKFRDLEEALKEQVGRAGFLDVGDVADWEDESPSEEQIAMLEKKSCIAEALARVLSNVEETEVTINSMTVGDPFEAARLPDVLSGENVEMTLRVFPVDISINAPIAGWEKVVASLTQVTEDAPSPLVSIGAFELEVGDDDPAQLELGLNVLDFYELHLNQN